MWRHRQQETISQRANQKLPREEALCAKESWDQMTYVPPLGRGLVRSTREERLVESSGDGLGRGYLAACNVKGFPWRADRDSGKGHKRTVVQAREQRGLAGGAIKHKGEASDLLVFTCGHVTMSYHADSYNDLPIAKLL